MDMNAYCLGMMVHERLSDLRQDAARHQVVSRVRPARPLRVTLGLALIRLGRLAAGGCVETLLPRPS